MTQQPPRVPVGGRAQGVAAGGRWASKQAPDVEADDIGFTTDPGVSTVGEPYDWHQRTVNMWGAQTTFERTVGDEVVTVTTDCDDATLLLLARKGDTEYWSGETWANHDEDRRIWCADIACRMLEEGLVAAKDIQTRHDHVKDRDNPEGIAAVMLAAGSQEFDHTDNNPHALNRRCRSDTGFGVAAINGGELT